MQSFFIRAAAGASALEISLLHPSILFFFPPKLHLSPSPLPFGLTTAPLKMCSSFSAFPELPGDLEFCKGRKAWLRFT